MLSDNILQHAQLQNRKVAKKKSCTKKSFSQQCGSFLKIWPLLNKFFYEIWKGFLRNMPLTLTSQAKVLNPKACGVQGRSFRPIFFYRYGKINGQFFFKFKSGQIYMKRAIRNQFLDFCNFQFLRYGRFCTENWSIFFMILSTNSTITQKIKIGIFLRLIIHSIQHCAHLSSKYGHF